ncbi:YitT family protein [Candidatus Phytoplasma pruni]|uniref:Uncharacterized protein n=1 Tax=Candidatus Phytoplasma pruni TaxID=479893 RepID=A0A851HJD5_9MOLU|nr:YitT family protein [Candidatus Phytoplasma pruni]NWN45656.1 hypothetical protein [Candidatus Phytoplasma pruni]
MKKSQKKDPTYRPYVEIFIGVLLSTLGLFFIVLSGKNFEKHYKLDLFSQGANPGGNGGIAVIASKLFNHNNPDLLLILIIFLIGFTLFMLIIGSFFFAKKTLKRSFFAWAVFSIVLMMLFLFLKKNYRDKIYSCYVLNNNDTNEFNLRKYFGGVSYIRSSNSTTELFSVIFLDTSVGMIFFGTGYYLTAIKNKAFLGINVLTEIITKITKQKQSFFIKLNLFFDILIVLVSTFLFGFEFFKDAPWFLNIIFYPFVSLSVLYVFGKNLALIIGEMTKQEKNHFLKENAFKIFILFFVLVILIISYVILNKN